MIYCIEFEREHEGKDVIHYTSDKAPSEEEAIELIRGEGYIFNEGYDEIRNIYPVKGS